MIITLRVKKGVCRASARGQLSAVFADDFEVGNTSRRN